MGMRLATEVRGRRRAAAIRKEEEGQCPSPCSGPAGAPLLAWAWLAAPWMWGGGPHGAGTAGTTGQDGPWFPTDGMKGPRTSN
jgi:hypothetical protein